MLLEYSICPEIVNISLCSANEGRNECEIIVTSRPCTLSYSSHYAKHFQYIIIISKYNYEMLLIPPLDAEIEVQRD